MTGQRTDEGQKPSHMCLFVGLLLRVVCDKAITAFPVHSAPPLHNIKDFFWAATVILEKMNVLTKDRSWSETLHCADFLLFFL